MNLKFKIILIFLMISTNIGIANTDEQLALETDPSIRYYLDRLVKIEFREMWKSRVQEFSNGDWLQDRVDEELENIDRGLHVNERTMGGNRFYPESFPDLDLRTILTKLKAPSVQNGTPGKRFAYDIVPINVKIAIFRFFFSERENWIFQDGDKYYQLFYKIESMFAEINRPRIMGNLLKLDKDSTFLDLAFHSIDRLYNRNCQYRDSQNPQNYIETSCLWHYLQGGQYNFAPIIIPY